MPEKLQEQQRLPGPATPLLYHRQVIAVLTLINPVNASNYAI